MIMEQMLVRVDMGLAIMGMRMDMNQIVFLQEFNVSQYLGWLATSY